MQIRSLARAIVARAAAVFGLPRMPVLAPAAPAPSGGGAAPPRKRRKRRSTPQTVTVTRWHQHDVEAAQHEASSGDLTRAGQLYRALGRDGTIHGLLGTRAGGLVRLPRRISGDPVAVAYLEGTEGRSGAFEVAVPDAEAALLDTDGIVIGVGVGELLDVPGCSVPVLCRLDPEFLRYHWWEDTWYYASAEGLQPITPGDGRWVLHCPGGRQEPWNRGLWAALARAYISKEHAIFYRENWNSKLAHPARVAFSPAAATEEQHESWFQKVMAWGINTVFGLKPGYDVKLLESNGKGYESFRDTISDANQECMVAIAGQVVTVTGGAGFANADIHATIRSDLIQGDGKALAWTLNTQVIPYLLCGHVSNDATARVEWDTRPPANRKSEAESLSAAAKAIEDLLRVLAAHGQIDVRALAARFAVPFLPAAPAPAIGALPPATAANDGEAEEGEPTEAPLTDEAVNSLAVKMSEAGVERCEHGRVNRCWMCGIERVRDFELDDGGAPLWRVAWRPIGRGVAA